MRRTIDMLFHTWISIALCWLFASMSIDNFICDLQDGLNRFEDFVKSLESVKNILRMLINSAETPCILLSCMLYLLYKVLLHIHDHFRVKQV